ncbi:MAG: TonB-dependent receptor [Raineya sp.]
MGTARVQALGGANVAVGADAFSGIANPAGLGLSRRGQVNFGLNFNNFAANTDYIGNSSNSNYSFLKINNFSIISPTEPQDAYSKFKGGAWSFGVTRTNNFQRKFSYAGTNTRSTMADRFTQLADGIDANIFENEAFRNEILDLPSLAYAGFVINPFLDDSTAYYTEFRDVNDNLVAPIRQSETITAKGGETNINFAYGGNYNNKVYFGFGIGITSLRYIYSSNYNERLTRQAAPNELQEFTLRNNRSVTGGGVNFNFGLLFRPIETLRIGASFLTPTFYNLDEKDENTMTSSFNSSSFLPITNSTIPTELNYRYNSPMRANLGIAYFFEKRGFITAEAEWVNYKGMSITADNANLEPDNQTIGRLYGSAFNLRAGAEARFDVFRVRAGAAYFQSPYAIKLDDLKRDILSYTGGVGIFLKNSAFDLALSYTPSRSIYTPYTLNNPDFFYSAESKNTQISAILSFSFFF